MKIYTELTTPTGRFIMEDIETDVVSFLFAKAETATIMSERIATDGTIHGTETTESAQERCRTMPSNWTSKSRKGSG